MRALVLTLALLLALTASGCLRNKFDLCAQSPPDPSCNYLDGGTDGGRDATTD